MKKLFFLLLVIAMSLSACSPVAKLINTSSYNEVTVANPVAAVFADLEVSTEKITYFMIPSKIVLRGGYNNVVETAVREALLANGNADVLVALEKQIKYGNDGQIESITVTGYPAKYVNFRSPGDEYLRTIQTTTTEVTTSEGGFFGKIKIGK
jgi:hypothetical protein